jgi:copper resistance protein C
MPERRHDGKTNLATTDYGSSSFPTGGVVMAIHRALIATAALLLYATAALAHAHLVRAAPAEGATVKEAPTEVTLKFNERLEPSFSAAVIRDAAGKQVDKADAHVDKADRTTVRVSLPPLEPGVYTVEWRVMSADTHKVNGNFTFRVGE